MNMSALALGDPVEVLDPGLAALREFAPENAYPNHWGRVAELSEDGKTVTVEFPILNSETPHSQIAPYPTAMVRKREAGPQNETKSTAETVQGDSEAKPKAKQSKKRHTKEAWEHAQKLYEQGLKASQIQEITGIPPQTLYDKASRNKWIKGEFTGLEILESQLQKPDNQGVSEAESQSGQGALALPTDRLLTDEEHRSLAEQVSKAMQISIETASKIGVKVDSPSQLKNLLDIADRLAGKDSKDKPNPCPQINIAILSGSPPPVVEVLAS